MKLILALSFLVTIAQAQLLSVGVLGGVPVTDSAYRHDESKPYIVGPTVEIRLPAGFALEADALYQRLGNSSPLLSTITGALLTPGLTPTSGFAFTTRQRGNSWQFPLLGKYYFRSGSHLQPFVAGGPSFRTIGAEVQGVSILTYVNGTTLTPIQSKLRTDLGVGAVAAAGFRYKIGHLALLPEFRYTRWGSDDRIGKKNSAGVYLGLSF